MLITWYIGDDIWKVFGTWNNDNKNVIKNWYFPYCPISSPMTSQSSCGFFCFDVAADGFVDVDGGGDFELYIITEIKKKQTKISDS